MALENRGSEHEDVRKKALLRLAVAGLVTATALAGLWWLDRDKTSRPAKVPSPAVPSPITSAAPLDAPPPQTEATLAGPGEVGRMPEQSRQTPRSGSTNQPPPTEPRSGAETPPPPKVSNLPRTVAPPPASLPAPPPSQPPAVATPAPTVPPGTGFVLQLGVFSNPDNAREMVEKLKKRGIRAYLETRVQVGPFLNQAEAEKAQAEMRKLGFNALVTTAAATK